ncbi:MAG TPA: hypothetical protein VEW71_05520 [Allosphingosinicella sp.]|nr:hypothetical protein [Allosphingosinicella sp.]
MKALGSLIVTVLIALVAIWLVFKLLVGALKLVGLLIVVGLAFVAFYAVKRRIGGPDA